MTRIKVAVLQFESEVGQIGCNVDRSLDHIQQAAADGARVVVLPELCQSGYDLTPEAAAAAAEEIGGETVARWAAAAREHEVYIVAGLCERDGDAVYNSAVLVGPQGHIGTYRKCHRFFRETEVFRPGNLGFPVFDLGWGKVGLLICYDLRFPEAVRLLALRGADLVCVPTAWVTLRGQRWDDRGYCMQAYCVMAHASMNRLFMACADTIGPYRETTFLGGSLICGPDGWPLAGPAPSDRPTCLMAEVELKQARTKAQNAANDLLADRRTDVYGDYPTG